MVAASVCIAGCSSPSTAAEPDEATPLVIDNHRRKDRRGVDDSYQSSMHEWNGNRAVEALWRVRPLCV